MAFDEALTKEEGIAIVRPFIKDGPAAVARSLAARPSDFEEGPPQENEGR